MESKLVFFVWQNLQSYCQRLSKFVVDILVDAQIVFDDFVELLKPYSFFIRCPMIIIGLEGLETFYIDKKTKMPIELTNQ